VTLRLLGYSDRLTVAPGDTIRFMVSCDSPEYESRLVRLIHGDVNPAGPGFKQVEIVSSMDGRRRGKHEDIHSGSYVEIPLDAGAVGEAFTFTVFAYPTLPGCGGQVIAMRGDWSLALDESGALALTVGSETHTTGAPVKRYAWYLFAVSVDPAAGRAAIWQQPLRRFPNDETAATIEVALANRPPTGAGPLILAGHKPAVGPTNRHFDGKLDRPRLLRGTLSGEAVLRLAARPDDLAALGPDLVGAWDFSADIPTDRVTDTSANGRHGWTVNMPTRGVTGHNFSGRETSYRLAPQEYGAIHFHRDDLEDAKWGVDFAFRVPDDLPSGIYAAWLRTGEDEDHIPFTVRPPRGTSRSKIAVLMSTLTYHVYANFTDLGPGAWKADGNAHWSSGAPHVDPTLFREVYEYIDANALYGMYDCHVDGSGVVYTSYLRPMLNMRPKFRYRIWAAPPRFPADLYLVDWLDHQGIEVDYITDHDLQAEGADLLRPYSVVVSSSHHEYWSSQMLDALETYLGEGGRFMYLGGNSLFGVTSWEPGKPHKVEVRRWAAPWPFEVPPAERYHSTTGEPGGIWRNRGRAPNTIVGVGTSAAGFDTAVPYKRQPDSYDPRVRFIFEGVEGDLIGDQPSLQCKWGAAGYEIDRYEPEFGSPQTTLLLGSSIGFSDAYSPMVEEVMWYMPGRGGKRPSDPQVPGTTHQFVRSDMVYLEYPNSGAVFSVGSIAWRGCISAYDYRNTVSTVTENVLRRFAEAPRGQSTADPANAAP